MRSPHARSRLQSLSPLSPVCSWLLWTVALFSLSAWSRSGVARAQLSFDFEVETSSDEQEALYRDLSSLVIFHERLDWISDEQSLQNMEGKLLEVICQLEQGQLKELQQSLQEQISTRGRVEERWREAERAAQRGEAEPPELSDYRQELRVERVLMALERGIAQRARCPFWLNPRGAYKGIHRDAGRFQLILESMGSLQVVRAPEGWSLKGSQIGGSTQGRLLIAHGLSLKTALAIGIELGGASTFPTNQQGERELKGLLTGGVPMMLRWWLGGLRFDTEASLLARFPEGGDELLGFRVSQGVGFSTLRVSGLLPHFMIWTGFESFYPEQQAQITIFRIGTRVGFSWGS